MRQALLLIPLLGAVLAGPALATDAEVDDPVLTAMEEELARAFEALGQLDPAPYYIGLQTVEVRGIDIAGEEGGLQGYRPTRWRMIHADVRVGSPELDSTHPLRDLSWDGTQPPGRELPTGTDPGVLQRGIWREIEARYRGAVDRWQQVQTDQQVLVREEASFDLAPGEASSELNPIATLDDVPIEAWEAAASRASAVFATSDVLLDPVVNINGEAETRWFVSTEGHRIREGTARYRASVTADTLAEDGTTLVLFDSWDSAAPDGLPDATAMEAGARALEQRLLALRAAPDQEPYTGPAILSGRAAAVFFHEIFGHRVEGHRLKQVTDAQTFLDQVGKAILPTFLSVIDDPTLKVLAGQDLRGHYRFDDQGMPAERVTLVRDGVLEGFLESRSPVRAGRSNAHGRRQAGHAVTTRQGNLVVEATNPVSDEELRDQLRAIAKRQGLEYGLYVDDIEGGFTFTERDIPNAFQINVVEGRRIYVDGRPDELVRGIDLIGTPLQTFGRIVAAGSTPAVFNGTCGAESGWVPVSATAPALLVEQIETQRKFKGQTKPPLLPPPGNERPPSAAEGSDVLMDALVAGLARATEQLTLQDAPTPSWAVAAVFDGELLTVSADLGTLRRVSGSPGRPGRVEIVVGDQELNSSRIDGGSVVLPEAVATPRFVLGDSPTAIARDLWLSTDDSYKNAVARLAFKAAARRSQAGDPPPPDWTDADTIVFFDDTPVPPVNEELLTRIALEASARLRDLGGALRSGQVFAAERQGRTYLADTVGTRIVEAEGHAAVYAYADIVLDDGIRLFDRRTWVARTSADLPSVNEIADGVEAMGRTLLARAEASAVGYYEGPVVFEGEAAADLFRYLLPPEVRGTPPVPEAGSSYQAQIRGGPRLGRRVLPKGWSMVDDPTSVPDGLAGGYRYDREGVAAQAVELVADGYVKDFLMTRVPRRDLVGSNGHARGVVQGEWGSRLSSWTVRPKKLVGPRAFDREVQSLRRAAGQPAVLVVRRMEQGWEGGLPSPTDAVWRFPDGTEVPVLGLEFQGVDRRTLRAIASASGGMQVVPYLAPVSPWSRAPTVAGIPMVVTVPGAVLVTEIETVFAGAVADRPTYPMPSLD
jgi:predicted Zn-dependent protease